MPKKAIWIKDAADGFDPDNNSVHLASGDTLTYDALVVCPGIQLDWDKIEGLRDTTSTPTSTSRIPTSSLWVTPA